MHSKRNGNAKKRHQLKVQKLTYLLINVFTLLGPLLLSFDKRVAFAKRWKYAFPAIAITGTLFLIWDYLFTIHKVWSFNPEYITGVEILAMPVEELLFFITVPFACIFIYECLKFYVKKDFFSSIAIYVQWTLLSISIIVLGFYYQHLYTAITFLTLAIVLIVNIFFIKPTYFGRFQLTYLVVLIPFAIVNGLLTSIPVVMYNDEENLGIRIGTIPLDDFFYNFSLLLININLFEYFRNKKTQIN